jgi:hypothetical protein
MASMLLLVPLDLLLVIALCGPVAKTNSTPEGALFPSEEDVARRVRLQQQIDYGGNLDLRAS